MLLPLDLPPGFLKVDSPNAGGGRFTDGDKIRFIRDKGEKWKGWVKQVAAAVVGIARGAVAWTDSLGNTNCAFGTHLKLYALLGDDTLTNITPVRATGTLGNNPLTTTNGSKVVTVAHTAHGANDHDFVTLAGAAAVGGITPSGQYQLTFVDANSYTITHTIAATSGAAGGGAAVTYSYEINTGLSDGVIGTGWGAGTYGTGTWGTSRTSGIATELRTWSVQEYGNTLLASPSGGGLYKYNNVSDAVASVVTNAPTAMRAMFVTGERFVFALGTTTPMAVQWPDQSDNTNWTPASNNTANSRTLQSGSKLMGGTRLGNTINLVWSDTSLYVFQYTGDNFVYADQLAGTNCGLGGPLAFCKVSSVAFWISGHHFHMYAGGSTLVPNQEDVREFVFTDMDPSRIFKTWCMYDERNNQVRWGYCSRDSATTEPDKYVDVELGKFAWTTGTLDRTTGAQFRASDASSLMVSSAGYIYQHDIGLDADGAALAASITYGLYALSNSEQNTDVMGIIPDFERQVGDVTFEVFTKDRPDSTTTQDSVTATAVVGDELEDIRVSGRHFSQTLTSNVLGGDLRLGVVKLEIGPAGERR